MRKHHWLWALLLMVWAVMAVSACQTQSTYQKSLYTLSGSKVTVENLAGAAKQLHRQGLITDEQIAKAEEAYVALQAVQKELIAAQASALIAQTDGTKQTQAANLTVAYLMSATRFINLAIEFGLIKHDDPSIKTVQLEN